MTIVNTNKYDVSDPAYYDPLIAEQKKQVRQDRENAVEWLELGRLFEARIDMIQHAARHKFCIRNFLPIFILSILGLIFSHHLFVLKFTAKLSQFGLISVIYSFFMVALTYMWFLRYPPSGKRYFKKAIALDADCGEAFVYLGLIALRRYKKRKACRYFEQAMKLNANNKNKIERKLKSVYEKEFMSFFNKKSEKETELEEVIDRQLDQIRLLRSKNTDLENRIERLNGKVDQAKWEIGHKAKQLNKEMKQNVSMIRKDYEDQIEAMKKEAEAEAKDQAERHFVNLTTEIMESKVDLEAKSLATASRSVEGIMGNRLYETLSEQTRSYLATAEHIYAVLADQEEKPDYSLVGMELCKALETELNIRLVKPFTISLNGNKSEFLKLNKTGEKKGRPSYFTYLAMVVDEANYPEVKGLTLGQYHFVLKLTLDGDYTLKEYESFLDEICNTSGTKIGKTFLKNIEIVTKKYRNAIAHQSPMNKNQYDHLRKLIFTGKKALLKTCCEIVADRQSGQR